MVEVPTVNGAVGHVPIVFGAKERVDLAVVAFPSSSWCMLSLSLNHETPGVALSNRHERECPPASSDIFRRKACQCPCSGNSMPDRRDGLKRACVACSISALWTPSEKSQRLPGYQAIVVVDQQP